MTNFQVYKKTLSFSLLMFAVDILALIVFAGLCVGGFFLGLAVGEAMGAVIGLIIGLILGIVATVLVNIFLTNRIKAAQISMMVKGVTSGELPERTFKAGFESIHGRFGKITVFFFITNAIKDIFRQMGRTLNALGNAIGGSTGSTITSVIDSIVQTLIAYLCDCCLGWVLYREDINPFKAGCEGAVIFFKHGKTLLRNAGRIFGMGVLSFLVIGGAFFGIFALIFFNLPGTFASLAQAVTEIMGEDTPAFVSDGTLFTLMVALIGGIIMWSILHSVLIRPFILTGVLRNYMAAGLKDVPVESDFKELDKYPGFAKLRNKAE